MSLDTIRTWLSEHPRVLTALFVSGLYLSYAFEFINEGGGSTYSGP
jgi:hypothetical protein